MVKAFVVLSAVIAVASASHLYLAPAQVILPSTSTQYHSQDSLGQYAFGYNDALSAKQETKTLDGVTRGSYAYIDSNGALQNVIYTADAGGFRVSATNLPKAPAVPSPQLPMQVEDTIEVAAAKSAHLAAVAEANNMNVVVESAPIMQVAAPLESPKPVEDTPEVAKAKIEHLQAIEQAKLGYSGTQNVNGGISLTQSAPVVAHYPLIYHTQPATSGFSYSSSVLNAPVVANYPYLTRIVV